MSQQAMSATNITNETMLEAFALRKTFGSFDALKEVNLKVKTGSIHGLIGPNGAGKTTVFNLLTKFLTPTSGRIVFDGQDVTKDRADRIARRGLVRSFQISAVFPHMTALENVRIALQQKCGMASQFWLPLKHLNSLDARALELLEQVNLASLSQTLAADLSY
jgi:branched-chain amino acid transport system ATP-binding protein